MVNLREQLNVKLKSIYPKIYFQIAPESVKFPYVIYDFPNSFTNEEQEIFNLDVDIWDMSVDGDTTELEVLTDKIWRQLHKYRHTDKNIQFSIHRINRLSLNEKDSTIRRRKLIFEVRFYDRRLYK